MTKNKKYKKKMTSLKYYMEVQMICYNSTKNTFDHIGDVIVNPTKHNKRDTIDRK